MGTTLVTGELGAGKSELLRAAQALAISDGRAACRSAVTAMSDAHSPASGGDRSTPQALAIVDDVHLLPDRDAAELAAVIEAGGSCVLLACRSPDRLPGPLRARASSMRLVELSPLDDQDIGALLEVCLDAPVHPSLSQTLRTAAGGNPFLVRQLLERAALEGSLRWQEVHWALVDDLPTATLLGDLIRAEGSGCGDGIVDAIDTLALLGRVDSVSAQDLGLLGHLAEMHRARLVVRADSSVGGRTVYSMPTAVSDALCATAGRHRLIRLLRRLPVDDLPRETQARLVVLGLELGMSIDPSQAMGVARWSLAQGWAEAASRCAMGAYRATGSIESAEVVGQSLLRSGRFSRARSFIDGARPIPDLAAALAETAVQIYGLGLDEPEVAAAVAHLAAADEDRLTRSSEVRAAITAASLRLYSSRPQQALELVGKLDPERIEPPASLYLQLITATAALLTADLDLAELSAARVMAEVSEPHKDPRGDAALAECIRCLVAQERGEPSADVELLGSPALRGPAVPGGTRSFPWVGPFILGRAALALGHPREAAGWLSVARSGNSEVPPSLDRWVSGLRAFALSLVGEDQRAAVLVDSSLRSAEFGEGWARARAQLLILEGHRQGAAKHLVAAAEAAAADGLHLFEALYLHDLVRLGMASDRTERRLAQLRQSGGHLAELRSRHARALRARRPDRLREVADDFRSVGSGLAAMDALAQAVAMARRASRRPQELPYWERELRERRHACQGSVTAATLDVDRPEALAPREHAIALLVANGSSSKAVADRLGISPRTVDNCLHRVYGKLGASGRDDLMQVLHPPPT